MPRILVVDDEPHILKLVSFTLSRQGFDVVEATDGLSGVKKAEREKPDLILMDVMMPVVDGLEAARRIKENPETRDIPIIMLSAKSQEYEQEAGLETGADRYMCKPFTPKDLISSVTELLDAEQRRR